MKDFILKTWLCIVFMRNKETLPTESKIINPKMKYEVMSGAIYWEDEGLFEHRNHHLQDAFKYVLNHRMNLIAGPDNAVGVMRSTTFDKSIFEMAKKHFPNWIGFDNSRCSYNSEFEDKLLRMKKVEKWRFQKISNS
jgi:hypothetical protein